MKKERNANIELLRMLSMFMIIFLHALGKGNLLVNLSVKFSVNALIAWIIEALSLSAVNIFMLISGYFLIDSGFKLRRLIELACETVFYSLGAFLVCLLFGIETNEPVNTYFLLHTVFPVHMELYWFISAYCLVYMFLPLINMGVKHLDKKQFSLMLIVLLVYECGFKSLLPVRLNEDKFGYNFLWFLIVFLVGAYFKLYGLGILNSVGKGFALYFVSALLILAENTALDYVTVKTGHLSEIAGISTEYNHIFVLLSAVGIFAAFINMQKKGEKASKIICALSPMALGVYLLHENLSLRYNWQKWLGIYDSLSDNIFVFVGRLILAAVAVFAAGVAIDFVRIKLFSLVGKKHEA